MADFHRRRLHFLEALRLEQILRENLYLFSALALKHTVGDLIDRWIERSLACGEEGFFDDFMKGLAVFVAGQTCDGRKSTAPIDWNKLVEFSCGNFDLDQFLQLEKDSL
jgi:hypothetical protein